MEGHEIELADGSRVLLRLLQPEDKDLVRAAFARLSDESRWRRFMSPVNELSDEDLAYLTEVDHHRHEAVVALDAEAGDVLGIGRWVRRPGEREAAELAVAVIDDWQRRGLGTQLVAALNDRARDEGIERYEVVVSVDNVHVIEALERHGAKRAAGSDPGTIDFVADVPPAGVGPGLATALRAAASGQLRLPAAAAGWLRDRVPWSRD